MYGELMRIEQLEAENAELKAENEALKGALEKIANHECGRDCADNRDRIICAEQIARQALFMSGRKEAVL